MKNKRLFLIFAVLIVFLFIVYVFSPSFAVEIDNDVRVQENSTLTYYIDVIYDGKDSQVVSSSDDSIADVRSDYIYIEDKLPEGLIFQGFVNSGDGSIGAVKRSDNTSCPGYVVDGVGGLEYDEESRTVSFRVKNLQAGCKITVGIETLTPSLGNQDRMDFYNTVYGREGEFSAKSNTVHVFMGKENIQTYNVFYQYTGDVPDNAPELPTTNSYVAGTSVGISSNVSLEGYTFSGWTTTDVVVSDNSFIMPDKEVYFTGRFTKNKTYQITYSIKGNMPDGYKPPKSKDYEEGADVSVDSLKPGDVINGYRFLGWKSDDVELSESSLDEATIFTMPAKDVSLIGSFEKISYTVTYQFQGVVIPPNAESLLPKSETYYPGDKVMVADNPTAEGYRFLGWYKMDSFIMPEEDVVIYGEWMIETGTFSPIITKKIVNPKDYYHDGDVVQFEITVENTADFPIYDVMIQEQTDGVSFVEGSGYILLGNNYIQIAIIPSKSKISVYAEYNVGDVAVATVTNTVELTGAIGNNYYYLDTKKDYTASVDFHIANLSLTIQKVDDEENQIKGASFGLYEDKDTQQLISQGLKFTNLEPNHTYYLKEERAPAGYIILPNILEVTVDSAGVISVSNYDVSNQNGDAVVNIMNKMINILPNTGGIGTIPFVIVGLLFIIGGMAGYLIYHKRKRR